MAGSSSVPPSLLVHSHLSPTTASGFDSAWRHWDGSCPSLFQPCCIAGWPEPLGERTATTAPPLKGYSLKFMSMTSRREVNGYQCKETKKRHSVWRNDPFIKCVCELKILNESDPVGKKNQTALYRRNSLLESTYKSSQALQTLAQWVILWIRCTLHSQQYWNSAAPGTQIYSIFTNKNATNNSWKKGRICHVRED